MTETTQKSTTKFTLGNFFQPLNTWQPKTCEPGGGAREIHKSLIIKNLWQDISAHKKTLEPKLKGYLPIWLGYLALVARAFEITLRNLSTNDPRSVNTPLSTIGVRKSDNLGAKAVDFSGIKLSL
jgi:hypothetical protein